MARSGRWFWILNALVWGAYAGLLLGVSRVADPDGFQATALILVTYGMAMYAASGALRSLALRRGWLEHDFGGLAWRMLAGTAAAATAVQLAIAGVLLTAAGMDWVSIPGGGPDYRPFSTLLYWLNSFGPMLLWSSAWVGRRALGRARNSELARLRAESERKALELDLLRARLNPHFVFNALNNLRALINEDPARARDLVTRLSNTLRQALEHDPRVLVPLADELAVVDDYLGIEGVHYEERLRVRRSIAEEALSARLPPMSLQLLVENAIKHGISRSPGGGELTIEARLAGDRLCLEVGNPGRLGAPLRPSGVGLAYLRAQLEGMATPGHLELREEAGRVLTRVEAVQ